MSDWISPAGAAVLQWIRRQAADAWRVGLADAWRGGLVLPRSPGQADRIPGLVRADRRKSSAATSELGAGHRHPGDRVQRRGAQAQRPVSVDLVSSGLLTGLCRGGRLLARAVPGS